VRGVFFRSLRYPVERALKSDQLARPIKVRFILMERIGPTRTQVAGQTEELAFTDR